MESSSSMIDPWSLSSSPAALFPESSWMTEAFARDNQALTRALQISLSDDSSAAPPLPDTPSSSAAANPLLSNSSLGIRRGGGGGGTGKAATKRKSRASKRSPTTYITADPENFRQMVQQVTGVRLGGGGPPAEPAVLRPYPQRAGPGRMMPPALDTSASASVVDRAMSGLGSAGPVGAEAAHLAFDLEPFMSFPTLESWSVM